MTQDEFVRKLAEPLSQADIAAITNLVKQEFLADTKMRLSTSKAPDGTSFPPLKYPRASGNGGPPLFDFGHLTRSVTERGAPGNIDEAIEGGAGFRWGTNLPYAATHQYGAVIMPRKASMLRIPTLGGGFAFARSAVIPKRPFIGASDDLLVTINRISKLYVTRIIVERAKALAAAAGWELSSETWSFA